MNGICSLDSLKKFLKKKATRIKKEIDQMSQQGSYRRKRTRKLKNQNDETLVSYG